jgi:hypothetical protein
MPLTNSLSKENFFYHEDEYCPNCGYQEVSYISDGRICTFCGWKADGPLVFSYLVKKCLENKPPAFLANYLLVSTPSVERWLQNKNIPRPNVQCSLRKALWRFYEENC